MAMPEPLQKLLDVLSSSISIGMLDRIYWRVFFTGVWCLFAGSRA